MRDAPILFLFLWIAVLVSLICVVDEVVRRVADGGRCAQTVDRIAPGRAGYVQIRGPIRVEVVSRVRYRWLRNVRPWGGRRVVDTLQVVWNAITIFLKSV